MDAPRTTPQNSGATPRGNPGEHPRENLIEITVLITAHNEAGRIEPCLRAIMDQDYPMERVEIVLVDDRSADDTATRARALGYPRLHIARQDAVPSDITARQAALHRGFNEARGEVVLITDAGGRAPREWIRELSGHLGYRDGAVTGPVIFAGPEHFLARFQTLDALVAFTLFRAVSRHNVATGLFGANMAVRRAAYFETGGFPLIGFAMSEDFALGMALSRAGWSLRYLRHPAVQKPTSPSLRDLLARARRRLHHISPVITTINTVIILTNVMLVIMAVNGGKFWLMVLIARYAVGVGILLAWASQYGATQLLPAALLFEPVATVAAAGLYLLNFVRPRWRWGGINYKQPASDKETTVTPAAHSAPPLDTEETLEP